MATETEDKSNYRACAICGRPVFADFLDEQGVCDYCREITLREDTIPSRFGKYPRKKPKKR